MEIDKSETHVRVTKNGIEDWISKGVVETLGGIDNLKKSGFDIMPTEPIEVQTLRSKKAEVVADAPEGTIESIEVLKSKTEVEQEVEETEEGEETEEPTEEPKQKRKYNKKK